ncbi:transglutaminase-like putative cysteine protease [Rhodoblastus sphagnicola]|uniref:transglutaminase family protein n=1 Tax=Rhodoblastus sphagnicola TaxID=333368 RepID=UPI0013048EC6|nr:transglutaminase family protein [Rhodoblastus sphagnicola]MBB4198534.1 transglutaminase-like putative cysteine protease [Rhodoblastus sphagnicola]
MSLQIEASYSEPTRSANQVLRLTPRPFDGLHVLDWFVGVEPVATLRRSEDGFGNIVHSCSHAGPLEKIVITAEGLVETQDVAGVARGLNEKQPLDLFLRPHEDAEEIAAFAAKELGGEKDRLSRLHLLMAALHEKLNHAPSDAAPRPVADVFADGEGSAREIAQVLVAAMRAQDIPARFVSGLLLDGAEGAAFHAWAEAYIDDIGWIGFDAALGFCPRDTHLRLAHGVGFFGAAPRRAAISGYAEEKVEKRLTISAARQASWQIQQ